MCATLGTNYQPDFEGKILFIEDIDEYYYAIDRLLWQLKFAGVFHHIKGLILGHFTKMKDNKIPFGMSLEEMVLEKIQEFDFPVAFNFPGGHENENWTLPFGVDMNFTVTKKSNKFIYKLKNETFNNYFIHDVNLAISVAQQWNSSRILHEIQN